MKFLLVPDSFKGSLSSLQVAEAMLAGVEAIPGNNSGLIFPMADGGEGSLQCIMAAAGGKLVSVDGIDALDRKLSAPYLRLGDSAFIELAQTAGLASLSLTELNPGKASTFGTGLHLKHAISQGAKELILCIGGSATNDAGLGIAAALGVTFLDQHSRSFVPTGDTLNQIVQIKRYPLPDDVRLHILCDVENGMVGPAGAVHTYAEQKGADAADRATLENNMQHLLKVFDHHQFVGVSDLKGAGAAGGVGGGLHALFGATLSSGIEYFIEHLGLDEKLKDCDVVLTGEGKLDRQTMHGKTIKGLIKRAAKYHKPVVAICGAVDLTSEDISILGLRDAHAIRSGEMSLAYAVAHASELISAKTTEVTKQIVF